MLNTLLILLFSGFSFVVICGTAEEEGRRRWKNYWYWSGFVCCYAVIDKVKKKANSHPTQPPTFATHYSQQFAL